MILVGHVIEKLRELADHSVHCVVTSPPYWGLRDYGLPPVTWGDGWSGQLGMEPTPELYVSHMLEVFREVRRVLRDDGTLWLNLGDCYATGAGSARNPGSRRYGKHALAYHGGAIPLNQPNRVRLALSILGNNVGLETMRNVRFRSDPDLVALDQGSRQIG